jgi:hypothetical protein
MLKTIQETEDSIEAALFRMRSVGISDSTISQALDFLAPRGFRPVVELQEDNRKKRRTASADNWRPATGQILIYFEPTEEAPPSPGADLPLHHTEAPKSLFADSRMSDLIGALDEAETSNGRTFVALKWFRDEFLLSKAFPWAQSYDERQLVLAKAISEGLILTSKVANPRAPLYPTTTIKVNRQRQQRSVARPVSRFRPVRVAGEPLSSTILRDRGSR